MRDVGFNIYKWKFNGVQVYSENGRELESEEKLSAYIALTSDNELLHGNNPEELADGIFEYCAANSSQSDPLRAHYFYRVPERCGSSEVVIDEPELLVRGKEFTSKLNDWEKRRLETMLDRNKCVGQSFRR